MFYANVVRLKLTGIYFIILLTYWYTYEYIRDIKSQKSKRKIIDNEIILRYEYKINEDKRYRWHCFLSGNYPYFKLYFMNFDLNTSCKVN